MSNAEYSPAMMVEGRDFLSLSGKIWFAVALVGQAVFIAFIVSYYGSRTFSGNFAAWNDKDLIVGHVPGDDVGNLMFAVHVLLAAYVTLGGIMQLVPALRSKFPALHRWNGRLYILTACFMALGGIWMAVVRGSYLSIVSGVATGLNGVLILVFAAFTLRHAMRRNIDTHRRWAMRTFMVVSGVWFFRVAIMAWIVINQGPVGMNATLSGPADIVIAYGSYLIPLAGLELYFAAQRARSATTKRVTSAVVLCLTAVMGVGVFGATMFMWLPLM